VYTCNLENILIPSQKLRATGETGSRPESVFLVVIAKNVTNIPNVTASFFYYLNQSPKALRIDNSYFLWNIVAVGYLL